MIKMWLFIWVFIPTLVNAAISQQTYHTILNVTENVYSGIFQEHQKFLLINRNWQDNDERASAWHQEDYRGLVAELRIPGGIARHPLISADAFTLIVCHEIGHHLAGHPKIWKFSVEGQADYFGASECFRRILPKLPENYTLRHRVVPDFVIQRCHGNYITANERLVCIRTIMAGYRLAKFLAKKKAQKEPEFDKPELYQVLRTNFRAPSAQCRLDTYIAAALCKIEPSDQSIDLKNWLCSKETHAKEMLRPACWYHHQTAEAR